MILAFAAVYLGWGSTFFATREAVRYWPNFFIGGVRSLVAGGVLFLYCAIARRDRPLARGWWRANLSGFWLISIPVAAINAAERVVPSGVASLIFALVPIEMLGLACLRDRRFRLPWRTALGMPLGLLGVAILLHPAALRQAAAAAGVASGDYFRGCAWLLAGSLAWAGGSLYTAGSRAADSPLLDVAMQMLAGGAQMLAVSAVIGEFGALAPAAVSLKAVAALAYLTFIGSLLSFSAYVWLLRHVPAEQVATYAYVNPVVAVLLGAIAGGEPCGAELVVPAALIVLSVGLIVRQQATDRL